MKRMIGLLLSVFLVFSTVTASAQSSTSKKIVTVSFTNSASYTWATTAGYPSALTVDMTFNSGSYSNTFYLGYVRSGVQHDLLTYTADGMHTLVWYIPSRYLFQTGDKLVFSNSVPQAAVFTLNADFHY